MKIYELFDAPEKWTKGAYARNVAGEIVPEHDPKAVCWCLDGAFSVVYKDTTQMAWAMDRVYKEIAKKYPICLSLLHFNDCICTSYDELIETCKAADV